MTGDEQIIEAAFTYVHAAKEYKRRDDNVQTMSTRVSTVGSLSAVAGRSQSHAEMLIAEAKLFELVEKAESECDK